MQIKNKLSFLFTLLIAGLLLVFAVFIYYSSSRNRKIEYYESLEKEAITKANLLLEAKVDSLTLQTIYKENREVLDEVEVAIYNTDFILLYHDAVEIDFVKETDAMLRQIVKDGQIRFEQEKWQVLGTLFLWQDEKFILTAAAFDGYGYSKLENLKNSLILAFVFSLLIIFLAGRFFAEKALDPVSQMVKQVQKISVRHLDLRIPGDQGKDELAELARTFNELLNRLETSFEAQKSFVSNIAHELRTPLAAIISELDWTLKKDRTKENYVESIQLALSDAQKLSRLITALLDLAKASYDPSQIKFKATRIDETLMEARNEIIKAYPNYDVLVNIDDQSDEEPEIMANEYLIKTAFWNLIENACKYSPDLTCQVRLVSQKNHFQIHFENTGKGIPENFLAEIFKPFFRGERQEKTGSGIGLSLTQKIIQLHKGQIEVNSIQGQRTSFTISLFKS